MKNLKPLSYCKTCGSILIDKKCKTFLCSNYNPGEEVKENCKVCNSQLIDSLCINVKCELYYDTQTKVIKK